MRSALTGVVALALLMANPIQAQENDLLGIFFDPQGTITTYQTSAPHEIVPIYLVLLAPSHSAGITSWECILEARSENPAFVYNWQLEGGGTNYAQPPRFYVNFGTPLPAAEVLVLASASVLVAQPGTEITFYLHAYDPPSLLEPNYDYPVQTPNYGYGGGNLQALGWTSGCESEPVAVINDDGEDVDGELGGIPDQLAFGEVLPGISVVRNIWLTNPGTVTVSGVLDVSGEGFYLRHNMLAWIQTPCWFQLEPDQTLLIQVMLQPVSEGEHVGELTITMCGEVLTVPLIGHSPEACIVSPSSINFGELPIGFSLQNAFQISNSVNYGQLEGEVAFVSDCTAFAIVSGGGPFTLAYGEVHEVVVQFVPDQVGAVTCLVELGSQCDPVLLEGVGVVLDLSCSLDPVSIDFDPTCVGIPVQRVFTIHNDGNWQLVGDLQVSGSGFSLNQSGLFTLNPGQHLHRNVIFNPPAVGEYTGVITTGMSSCPSLPVAGIGTWIEQACSLTPAAMDFGDQHVGWSSHQDLVIRNAGCDTLQGNLAIDGDSFSIQNPGPFTLGVGQQVTRQVTFVPPGVGNFTGVVTTGLENCPEVPLTGNGISWVTGPEGEIVGWGSQAFVGESALTNLIALSAVGDHTLALRADGSIVAWGNNENGQCNVPVPNTDFVAVATGGDGNCGDYGCNAWGHSLGVKADGSIVAWGSNEYGECDVPAPNSGFVTVAAGANHSLGLRADRSIVAWGLNNDGQCDVPAPNTDFVAVAGGGYHSLGLKVDGSIVAWGANWYGECDVPTPNADFVAAATGKYHSLGLKADGSIVAWGWGPGVPPAPNTGFIAVAAGGTEDWSHSLGLKADGSVVAWGSNDHGQCNVPEPNTDFVAVIGGGAFWDSGFSVGLKGDGSVVTWGANNHGQCNVPPPNTGFMAVAAGGGGDGSSPSGHSLGLKTYGSIVAWGSNGSGQCDVPAPNSDFVAVAAAGGYNGSYSLGLKSDGSIVGWGNVPGGYPPPGWLTQCVAVAAAPYHYVVLKNDGAAISWGAIDEILGWQGGGLVAVAAGGSGSPYYPGGHILGLTAAGSIVAVGSNNAGQCNVPEANADFIAVAAGWEHSLGLKADGSLVAWGSGPGYPPGPNTDFVAIAAGGTKIGWWGWTVTHSVGLKADGSVVVWGDNTFGQCNAPTVNAGFVAVSAGGTYNLGLCNPAAVGVEAPWGPSPERDLQTAPVVRLQNQPNPFNPNTEIRYWMEREDAVTVSVFDLRGYEVCVLVNDKQPAGWNSVRWDGRDAAGRNVPTGVYFARMETEGRVVSCRMLLVR